MATYNNRMFANEDVEIDGHTFQLCSFSNCRLIFRGGDLPSLIGNRIDPDCSWTIRDAASRTVKLFQLIYANGGHGIADAIHQQITGSGQQPSPRTRSSTVTIQ